MSVTAGILLLGLGVVGAVLPVLPGILLFAAGVAILAKHFPWAHHLLEAGKRRFPTITRELGRAKVFGRRLLGQLGLSADEQAG